jgi:hypothetical protein
MLAISDNAVENSKTGATRDMEISSGVKQGIETIAPQHCTEDPAYLSGFP